MHGTVKVWQEQVELPTYGTGEQDSHPMFLENRVYQGSSGAVYPYGVIDTLSGEKSLRSYQAVYLENDYLRVMLLPELGGRIHRAYDKVQQRDFVYHNEVVKPALVGLLGPWISGGIEFNWPQHHRPTTYMPVDCQIQQHDNGAQTVWLGEVEPMRGLQVMAGFTLYPDRALIEISARIFNANPTPRHFLWWANPAVKGGDDHQSVFPPDVTAVFDHGKRDVSSFPIATGTYYKVDYSAGVDISRYKNIPVPTSYMAHKSDYDFVGAYSHDEQGGLLHIADHHVSPGKKQWSWGHGEFGQAWDRNLTDNNGPYIELMTGVYTDNQPDFTWLDAYEEKCFVQNFLPYNTLGMVQNANTRAALKLESDGRQLVWGLYAVAPLAQHRLVVRSDSDQQLLLDRRIDLSPGAALMETLTGDFSGRLTIELLDSQGGCVLSYRQHQADPAAELPQPAKAPPVVGQIGSADEAWFIGQHLEQYNHASRSAFDYYQRGLTLDPLDYRCNLALATLEYNRANFKRAIAYADDALARAHHLNHNPQCGLASLLRGCAHEQLGDDSAAYEDFYRAIWSGNGKPGGFYGLARVAVRRGDNSQSLEFCESSLSVNASHYPLIALKAWLLQLLGQGEQSLAYIAQQLAARPLHYSLYYLRYAQTREAADLQRLRTVTGCRGINALTIANQLCEWGAKPQAIELLTLLDSQESLPLYLLASLRKGEVSDSEYQQLLAQARDSFSRQVRFPNTLNEVQMLSQLPECDFAQYLLGCFHYSKRNYLQAVALWQRCVERQPGFADAWRNLGIYSFNKLQQHDVALEYLQRAFRLQPDDARLLFELDQLNKHLRAAPEQRLALLEQHLPVVARRDDLTAELLSLYNQCGRLREAQHILQQRQFHPWEGGEGKVTGQYLINLQRLAFQALQQGEPQQAQAWLLSALHYPNNLGEGRLAGQSDNDLYYWLGICAARQGDLDAAAGYWQQACAGQGDLTQSRYYNDQPVDYLFYRGMALKQLGQSAQAEQLFRQMQQWVQQQAERVPGADFFAVSLPDLMALDNDLQQAHQQHCLLVAALAQLGLGQLTATQQTLKALLACNPAHDKARLFSVLADALAS
ncbi:Predicted methyltransferase (contains TPR repeat) [Serratia quinivorans]|uniref:DUF5107 domain-containing protein n=1 Tax=Serratia quinivorans TaxID=137545 RepID=UPI0021792039|nr:DUF5107 domain-containing protein [Serratia quinivorans]CAI1046439.1 Predicted methyltransferase (contains TPR repeat) [Serratia quinivorans]CAI1061555.1 Predicted methyltransferase (contains TPR repeat) [Serratia quinivorans]CAI1864515.1 Predicted methyltransferase (contains TPR repeat) [Serratia quinivorans]CAI2120459.1 Predicted methyltransferase (contains TPR repeat) [Serratia quinivorans]CAI2486587.1 Predicted methyltransferase (contains TPR repeat) [Serratia quinivorans]